MPNAFTRQHKEEQEDETETKSPESTRINRLSLVRRLCPVCKSDRIMLWMGGYTGMMYRCPNCEYVGPVTIETDAILPEENDDKQTE